MALQETASASKRDMQVHGIGDTVRKRAADVRD